MNPINQADFNPIVLRNVRQWRKTHPCHRTAGEREAIQRRCDRWQVRHGRLVSLAQAFAQAKAA
jgi:hypothetical protein